MPPRAAADVALDMAGGDFVARNLVCLNPGGRHVSIAFLRGPEATINIFALMRKQLRLSGSTMKARSFEEKARLAKGLHEKFWPLIENQAIVPVIDRVFPLSETAEAHRRMEAGRSYRQNPSENRLIILGGEDQKGYMRPHALPARRFPRKSGG